MTISAKIIADSISTLGVRITTFELEYPRFIHAEFMTHRLFSRNAASSRAIPVTKAIELIKADTATPVHWGKNQPGMSAKEECHALVQTGVWSIIDGVECKGDLPRENAWNVARDNAIRVAEAFNKAGYHKQIVNRLLEPFTHIKVVCTATEYDNFFYLRCHPDAQPEIQVLATEMWNAREASTPVKLKNGEWHVPYYEDGYWIPGDYSNGAFGLDAYGNTAEDAIAISASCAAQVSYRKLDDSLEKAKNIYARLVESKPVHASPFEHQATPMDEMNICPDGYTHTDKYGNIWSGNLREWIQHRQLIDGHVCNQYKS